MELTVNTEITLRLLEYTDSKDIFNLIDSQRDYFEEWLPFATYTTSQDYTDSFVKSIIENPAVKYEPVFTIRYNGEFVGLIGLKQTDLENKKTEIGYWLSSVFQGSGIVTKSVLELCRYAFNELDINRVQIKCVVENYKSIAIPKRLNFVFEGVERDGELFPNGKYRNLEIYSLLKRDFY